MKKLIALASIALLFAGFSANAQSYKLFKVGAVLPMSDYSDATGLGVTAGFKYVYPVTESGLGVFGGLDFMLNGTNDDNKMDKIDGIDIKYPSYLNIPISVGLDFTYDLNKNIGVYAEAGVAYNFLKMGKKSVSSSVSGIKVNAESKYDLASHFGFRLGAGINLNDIAVGVAYYGLGDHTVTATSSGSAAGYGAALLHEEFTRNVNFLAITVGFKM